MLRAAAHFFAIGALLLVGRTLLVAATPPERATLRVVVPAEAAAEEVERLVDEAVVVAEGARRGWLETDPVVRDRLVRNMRFLRGEPADAPLPAAERDALLAAAIALGMHRTDPVVRQRLAFRLGREAELLDRARGPTERELEAQLAAHPERFRASPRARLGWVFLSRQRRGASLAEDALALGERLRAEDVPSEGAHRLGDPFLDPPFTGLVSLESLDRRLGPGFGDAVAALPPGRWAGPVESSYGLFFVLVVELERSPPPSLAEARVAVELAMREDRARAALAAHLRALGDRYEVVVDRGEGAAR